MDIQDGTRETARVNPNEANTRSHRGLSLSPGPPSIPSFTFKQIKAKVIKVNAINNNIEEVITLIFVLFFVRTFINIMHFPTAHPDHPN